MALDARPRIVYFYGSSSTATTIVGGSKNDSPIRLHNRVAQYMGRAGQDLFINRGVNGATLHETSGGAADGFVDIVATQIASATIPSGYRGVVNIMMGSNDISLLSRTAAQTYADLKTYVAAWVAAGFKVNVCTFIAWLEPSFTPLQTLNASIRSGVTLGGGGDLTAHSYSDPGGLFMFDDVTDPLNNTWYLNPDINAVSNVHATDAGVQQYAALMAAQLLML